MDKLTLAKLEQAIKPYLRAGFVVTSQSDGAITLTYPPERFSYLLFIILLLIWPLAVIYLISHNNKRAKSVCLRITSQDYIEVSGYTLEIMVKERRGRRFITLMIFTTIALIILFILLRVYLSRAQ